MVFKIFFVLFCSFTSVALARDSSRIIGGRNATLGQFPYQVGIITSSGNLCGGSILTENVIITAAHCTKDLPQDGLTIYAGTLRVGEGRGIKSYDYVVHDQYSPSEHDYDVSIIYLDENLTFDDNIKPIPLTDLDEVIEPFTVATVSGYGATNLALDLAPQLLYVNVPIQSSETCSDYFRMTPRMVCAGYENGQESSCQGDSGSPLTINGKLVGVVSFGKGCGMEAPAVYANVANLRTWIQDNAGI